MKQPKPARKLLREWKRKKEEDGVLYRVVQINGQAARQLILPGSLKSNVLKSIHDDLGHQAVEKTTVLARTRFYWPGMMADVADYCRTCGRFSLGKAGKKLHPTMSSLTATRPLEILAVDFRHRERACPYRCFHEIHLSYSHKGSEGDHSSSSPSERVDCEIWGT